MTRSFAIAAAVASLAAAADSGGVAAPTAGFFFDRSAALLRPITGLPGAARIGDSLTLPFPASSGATASGRDYALVVSPSGPVLVRGLRAVTTQILELPGAIEPST